MKKILISVSLLIYLLCFLAPAFAFERSITVPAEDAEGITVDLEKGDYTVELAGGAVALFFPINPDYRWLAAAAVGVDVKGGQDVPNIGTLYFDPRPAVYSQVEAEAQTLAAVEEWKSGTSLQFSLEEPKTVRFWVSDYDYTDNSGMVRLKVPKKE